LNRVANALSPSS
jgi:hypothetical protein